MNTSKSFSVITLLLFIFTLNDLQAQERKDLIYTDAKVLQFVGKIEESEPRYHRLDTSLFQNIPPTIKRLLTHSSGIAISFRTNSTTISAKWCTSSRKASNNNTGIVTEGLDLYIKKDGQWLFAGVGRPGNEDCHEYQLVANMDNNWKECLLYLPLVDELKSLFIGTDSMSHIEPLPNPFKHNILIYGSSIVHGSAASRPGLAYPSKLTRGTGLNFINFGFAGNAKMEKEVAEMIASLQVDAFILDCVPNTTPEQISERTANFIKTIRAKNPGKPVIAVQSIMRESGNFNQIIFSQVKKQNENFSKEINDMQKYDEHLYLITSEGFLGEDHEGTIDGTHPNDLGFDRMVEKLKPIVMAILSKYTIQN